MQSIIAIIMENYEKKKNYNTTVLKGLTRDIKQARFGAWK